MTRFESPRSPIRRLQQLLAPALFGFTFVAAIWAAPETESAAKPARSCVWKIEHEGATVYLAGSVHLLRETDHPLPPTYQQAYDASEKIFFEVDMAEMHAMETQGDVLKLSKLPEGETIKEHVSEETYKELKAYLRKRGLGGPLFETMKPGMLAMTISSLEAVQIGAMPEFGVEMHFDRQARKDEKSIKGLETTKFQIGLFDSLDSDEQDEMLAMTLDQIEDTPNMLKTMIRAWKAGDIEALDAELNKYFEEDDALTELLLYKRNENWIPGIEEELKSGKGSALFIVGAGHLVGKRSVNDLLEQKGYKLEQMTYEP